MPAPTGPLTATEMAAYERRGFHVARALFSSGDVRRCKDYFDAIAEEGKPIEGHWLPTPGTDDPLARYPRFMQPHVIDSASRARLLDPRVHAVLRQLLGDEVVAAQTMYYFKPPGARGQAFHQDNYYLRVKPYTCIAAWLAIDASTPENGGLQLCPGTHKIDVECPEEADPTESFAAEYVPPPPGHDPVGLELDPGDVLFFTGSVVHGSQPNRTRSQWRRSFISHYLPAAATHIGNWYTPYLVDFTGRPVSRDSDEAGGPCGTEADDRVSGIFH